MAGSLEPYNSFGNGAAMRVSPAGLLATSEEEVIQLAHRVTEVTHNHPEGLKGGAATALAIYLARAGKPAEDIRRTVAERFEYDLDRTPDDIRPTYVFNETCQQTVPEALICALVATDFEDAIRNAISIGGDSDTVAAIAGGVAEALFGIPEEVGQKGWSYLPDDMRAVLQALYRKAGVFVDRG
jgi:ADP-ribosylglycohydrolase